MAQVIAEKNLERQLKKNYTGEKLQRCQCAKCLLGLVTVILYFSFFFFHSFQQSTFDLVSKLAETGFHLMFADQGTKMWFELKPFEFMALYTTSSNAIRIDLQDYVIFLIDIIAFRYSL